MPLVRFDYDESASEDSIFNEFIQDLLELSMKVFNTDEDQISIFCSPYSKNDRSTAAAEIEYRAGSKEFVDEARSPVEMQEHYLAELQSEIKKLKSKYDIKKGLIVTVTIENWKVKWIG